MADHIAPGSDSWATQNMKPAGGGDEELNALWGRYISADLGFLYRFVARKPIYCLPTIWDGAGTQAKEGTITTVETTTTKLFEMYWMHPGLTGGTLRARGKFWYSGAVDGTFYANFNGTDIGTKFANNTSATDLYWAIGIPNEIYGEKYIDIWGKAGPESQVYLSQLSIYQEL